MTGSVLTKADGQILTADNVNVSNAGNFAFKDFSGTIAQSTGYTNSPFAHVISGNGGSALFLAKSNVATTFGYFSEHIGSNTLTITKNGWNTTDFTAGALGSMNDGSMTSTGNRAYSTTGSYAGIGSAWLRFDLGTTRTDVQFIHISGLNGTRRSGDNSDNVQGLPTQYLIAGSSVRYFQIAGRQHDTGNSIWFYSMSTDASTWTHLGSNIISALGTFSHSQLEVSEAVIFTQTDTVVLPAYTPGQIRMTNGSPWMYLFTSGGNGGTLNYIGAYSAI